MAHRFHPFGRLWPFAGQRPSRAQAGRALDAARHWVSGFERDLPEPGPELQAPDVVVEEEEADLESERVTDLDDMFSGEAAIEEPEEREPEEP